MTTEKFGTDIHKTIQIIELFRKHDPEMGAQMISCFLHICGQPGLTMQNLCDLTKLSQSSASRNVQTLGKWHRIGKPGRDLVEAVEDPHDTRRKIMFPTKKGETLMSEILTAIRGTPVEFRAASAKETVRNVLRAASQ